MGVARWAYVCFMIEVRHFSYVYGSHRAVDDISFSVPCGEIVALVGPNGAGKSTTMKVLTTLLKPACGEIRVGGLDVVTQAHQVRRKLGYLPENNPLYGDMLVADALCSMAEQHFIPKKQIPDAVARVVAFSASVVTATMAKGSPQPTSPSPQPGPAVMSRSSTPTP